MLTTAFGAAQVVGGLLLHSVALLADAAHNLTDGLAVGLALVAAVLAGRRASGTRTFGFGRVEILVALANGLTLLVLAALVAFESVQKLADPPDVRAPGVIVFGLLGLAANGAAVAVLLRSGQRGDLNLQAAMRHTAGDALASLGVLVAGVLVAVASWNRADPAIALLVSAAMAYTSIRMITEPVDVLLERAPRGVDPDEIGETLCRIPGVRNVHDLHVWTITSGFDALSVHVVANPGEDQDALLHRLEHEIATIYGIAHTTIQIDVDHAGLLQIHRPGCPEAPRPRKTPVRLREHHHDH